MSSCNATILVGSETLTCQYQPHSQMTKHNAAGSRLLWEDSIPGATPHRPRVLAEGQWLGSSNRIKDVRRVRGQWIATDTTGCLYTQDEHPEGLKTFDEKASGLTQAPRTPWPQP